MVSLTIVSFCIPHIYFRIVHENTKIYSRYTFDLIIQHLLIKNTIQKFIVETVEVIGPVLICYNKTLILFKVPSILVYHSTKKTLHIIEKAYYYTSIHTNLIELYGFKVINNTEIYFDNTYKEYAVPFSSNSNTTSIAAFSKAKIIAKDFDTEIKTLNCIASESSSIFIMNSPPFIRGKAKLGSNIEVIQNRFKAAIFWSDEWSMIYLFKSEKCNIKLDHPNPSKIANSYTHKWIVFSPSNAWEIASVPPTIYIGKLDDDDIVTGYTIVNPRTFNNGIILSTNLYNGYNNYVNRTSYTITDAIKTGCHKTESNKQTAVDILDLKCFEDLEEIGNYKSNDMDIFLPDTGKGTYILQLP